MLRAKIGAIWIHKDKNGKDYYSGTIYFREIGEIPILMFPVLNKVERGPEYEIVEAVSKEKNKTKQ